MKKLKFVGYVPKIERLAVTIGSAVDDAYMKHHERIRPRFGMERSKKECLETGYGFKKVVRRTITITVKDEDV